MAKAYRAVAQTHHDTFWDGRWHKKLKGAEEQAERWREQDDRIAQVWVERLEGEPVRLTAPVRGRVES